MNSDNKNITDNVNSLIQPLILKSSSSGSRKITIKGTEIYLVTSKGFLREENQDRVIFALIENQVSIGTPLAVAVLADGMGGMLDGDKAASLAISSFISYIATGHSDKGLKNIAGKAVIRANEDVFQMFKGEGGTTLSAIIYGRKGCVAVNVGDSRIFYFNRNDGVKQLSVDDTIAGHLKKEHNNINNWFYPTQGDHRLAQFVGMGEGIESHCIDLSEYYKKKDAEAGYLLTSDGAHYIENLMLNQLILKSDNREEIPYRVASVAEWLSGHDNISLMLLPTFLNFGETDEQITDLYLRVYSVCHETNFVLPSEYYHDFSAKAHIAEQTKLPDERIEEKITYEIVKAKNDIKQEIMDEIKNKIKQEIMDEIKSREDKNQKNREAKNKDQKSQEAKNKDQKSREAKNKDQKSRKKTRTKNKEDENKEKDDLTVSFFSVDDRSNGTADGQI